MPQGKGAIMRNALSLLMSLVLLAQSVPLPAFAADKADDKARPSASPKFGEAEYWSRWRNVVVNNDWRESYYCFIPQCDPPQPPAGAFERGKNWVRGKLGLKTPPPADIPGVPLYSFKTDKKASRNGPAVVDSSETPYLLFRAGGAYYALDRSSGKRVPARFEPGLSSLDGKVTVRPPKKENPAPNSQDQSGSGSQSGTPPGTDPLSRAFPDKTERTIVLCFGKADAGKTGKGDIDAKAYRERAALRLRDFLTGQSAPKPADAVECASLAKDQLPAMQNFYCDNEPPSEGAAVSKKVQELGRLCSTRRFAKAFPQNPVAIDVLKCLAKDGLFPWKIKQAEVKKYGDIALWAAQDALDEASAEKRAPIDFGNGLSLGKNERSCVRGLNKEQILLSFYCDNEPKASAAAEAQPPKAVTDKCVDKRFEHAFPDAAERKVLECTLDAGELAAVKRNLPAAGSAERETLFSMPALKVQAVLLGGNTPAANTARLSAAEEKCLKPVKDKLRAFYCAHEPAEFVGQEGATGAQEQGELIGRANQSGAGGEKGMFEDKTRAESSPVPSQPLSPALQALQDLQGACSKQRKEEEQKKSASPTPAGFYARRTEPQAASGDRDTKKADADKDHADLMKNLKKDAIAGCFGAAGFGILGFILGGPVGAVIGAAIGFGFMGALTHLANNPIK